MKVLLVNKFLYPKGGAETYTFKLGKMLEEKEHSVEYFGIFDERNIVGNTAESYAPNMDLTAGVKSNLTAPFKIIYSSAARRAIKKVLKSFSPDVVHLNNIQFHLTPSIILEIEKYRKKSGKQVKIVYTAHDYQLICPSHGLFDTNMKVCEKCLGGNYMHCIKTKCVKGSFLKSVLGATDAYFWKLNKAYKAIDTIICPSHFLKQKLDLQNRFADKTVALHNFIELPESKPSEKKGYILEFGHLSRDKGTLTLLEAAKRMKEYNFVFAGFGSAQSEIEKVPNATYVGFKTGDELKKLISEALCSVYPSEWYENCPFSVVESQIYLTPVVASRMGGIPELMVEGKTGLLFEAGNSYDLESKLRYLLETEGLLFEYTKNCEAFVFETGETYYGKLMQIYGEQ